MSSTKTTSPNKLETKSSVKKSAIHYQTSPKPDQSKSRKKLPTLEVQSSKENPLTESKDETLLLSRSTKRDNLKAKEQSKLKQHAQEIQKSEKCGKLMKSTDKPISIKQNRNTIESNQRQFSLSKGEQQGLNVSKKKIATQSKQSKFAKSEEKHAKTEIKAGQQQMKNTNQNCSNLANFPLQPLEKTQRQVDKQNEVKNSPQPLEAIPQSNLQKTKDSKNMKLGSQKETQVGNKSKNFKRSQVSKSGKNQDLRNGKSSKSIGVGHKSASKSKDSKISQEGKNGVKKVKPVERWH